MQLSQSEVQDAFDYHPDGYLIRKSNGKRAGSSKGKDCEQIGYKYGLYRTHRLVFLYHHGYLPAEIDHINRDPFDNRIENLRGVTSSQNKMNRSNKHGNVWWHKQHMKWMVVVGKDGKKHWGGYFSDKSEADKKAAEMREELHGEYNATISK